MRKLTSKSARALKDPEVRSLVLELVETIDQQVSNDLFMDFVGDNAEAYDIRAEWRALQRILEEVRRLVAE